MATVLIIAGLMTVTGGCHVYSYIPTSSEVQAHDHLHDGMGHCRYCSLYYYEGIWYTQPTSGWLAQYGEPQPPSPVRHVHIHDGRGHCRECGYFLYRGRWYSDPPPGWFEMYYRWEE